MLLAGIISHSEETAGLIRRFLGEMTRSKGLSLSCVSYDNSYAFLGDWGGALRPALLGSVLFARGGDADGSRCAGAVE